VLVSPTFGAYGGIEAFVLAVDDHLRSDPRFEVRTCFKRVAGFELQPDFERLCRSCPVEFFDRASRGLWSAVAWADVVHAQNASPDIAATSWLLRKPLALTMHNALPSGPPLRRLTWRIAARMATARWYNSRFVWQSWERQSRSGSAHVPTISQLPAAYVPPVARRGFVFLGRMIAGKGADILLEAYRRAALDPEVWPLTFLGEGPVRVELERRCTLERTPGVRFARFVAGDVKARALAKAKWLVAPSHWQEPFGLVALEARSVAVPCIVTADGGLPEAAGRDALVCPPADPAALADALRRAAAMPDSEYASRSCRTHADLEAELTPLSFYLDAYVDLAAAHRGAAGLRNGVGAP
jgi:glycosyltransferase involved in cell wall biosynthesis